jgi:hypothetical protein
MEDECHANAVGRCVRCNQDFLALERLVKIVHGKGDVRDSPDHARHATVVIETHPLNSVWACFKTSDMNAEVIEVLFAAVRA